MVAFADSDTGNGGALMTWNIGHWATQHHVGTAPKAVKDAKRYSAAQTVHKAKSEVLQKSKAKIHKVHKKNITGADKGFMFTKDGRCH